ncbi:MAG: hypothetical protein U5K79_22255 [Cyclobacteriaceae bacterium]|nr:hypothetical protein [Cyclobacteriaceae bacterium]
MKNSFHFLRPPAFPQVVYVGYVILIVAAVRFISAAFQSATILLALSLVLLILRSWIRLDLLNHKITKYFIIIPYKTITLENLQKIVMTKSLVHQTLNSRGSTTTLRLHEYQILLLADDDLHLLMSGLDRDLLFNKAKKVAEAAHIPMEDRSV